MALQKLGPYVLESVLGRGGMGTVYRAVDAAGNAVAVKALAPTLCLDEHFRHRFESEIETMLKMDHPNIVRLLGYGQDDGVMFFAMELVDGKSLFALQKDKVLFDWRAVLRITLDVCAGLQHAHNRGIIHRDLKPGNLIREGSGNVKITDFGIAKSFGGSNLTGEGSVLGTMDFMSPEQARTGKVTVRSDLYSLGAVMYTLLARRPPLHADSIEESLKNLTSTAPPDIRSLVPGIPTLFSQTIHRLLEKDPNRRFATALALSKHLIDLQHELRETAEAKTETGDSDKGGEWTRVSDPIRTQASSVRESPTPHDTTSFELAGRATAESELVSAPAGERETAESSESRSAPDKTAATQAAPVTMAAAPPPPPQDFYNPVTADDRRRYLGETPPPRAASRQVWPLAVALIAVLGLLGYGIYEAVFRQRTPDRLLSRIDAKKSEPISVLDEIGTFIKLYPQHERAAEIVELQEWARAIQLRRRLTLQKGLKGVNPLEQRFLDSTDLDTVADAGELERMLAFYQTTQDLDPKSREIVAAAQAYLTKFLREIDQQTDAYRPQLEQTLAAAAAARAAGDGDRAAAIYAAVVKFYGDKFWAQELVRSAQAELDK